VELYGLIGLASYCLVSLVVGVRLLALARRTRELPECLIGAGFLGGGCFGYTALVISGELAAQGATTFAGPLFCAGWGGLVTAALCLLWFWRRVYHPNLAAARHIAVAGGAVLVASLVGIGLAYEPGGDLAKNPWYLPALVFQGGAYALNGWASARYYAMLRRRLTLGLADPVVVNRILLWGLAAWAITLQYVYSVIYLISTGARVTGGSNTAIISSLGIVAAATMVLAFFPPTFYLRRIRRAGTSEPSS
jgi:hypothetical protein